MKKIMPNPKVEFEITHKISISQIVYKIVDEFGIKKILCYLMAASAAVSTIDGRHYEDGKILKYVLDNWNEVKKESIKHWDKLSEKARKENLKRRFKKKN